MSTDTLNTQSGELPDYDIGVFGMAGDFDINQAFQEAIRGVADDTELALEEKVRRMETIITKGAGEVYRDFINFRQMTAQIEMMCNHDHSFSQLADNNNTISSFMDRFRDDGHIHGHDKEDKYEIDPKTGKKVKKKKRRGWLGLLID